MGGWEIATLTLAVVVIALVLLGAIIVVRFLAGFWRG